MYITVIDCLVYILAIDLVYILVIYYLVYISVIDQKQYQVDISAMLEDEVAWLSNFVPTEHPDLKETDNVLLAGHLKLIKTLFTCEGICKEEYGKFHFYVPTLRGRRVFRFALVHRLIL